MKYFFTLFLVFTVSTTHAHFFEELDTKLEALKSKNLYSFERFSGILKIAKELTNTHTFSSSQAEDNETLYESSISALTQLIHATYEAGGLKQSIKEEENVWTVDQDTLETYMLQLQENQRQLEDYSQEEEDMSTECQDLSNQYKWTSKCLKECSEAAGIKRPFSFEQRGTFPLLFYFSQNLTESQEEDDLFDVPIEGLTLSEHAPEEGPETIHQALRSFLFNKETDSLLLSLQKELESIFYTLKNWWKEENPNDDDWRKDDSWDNLPEWSEPSSPHFARQATPHPQTNQTTEHTKKFYLSLIGQDPDTLSRTNSLTPPLPNSADQTEDDERPPPTPDSEDED